MTYNMTYSEQLQLVMSWGAPNSLCVAVYAPEFGRLLPSVLKVTLREPVRAYTIQRLPEKVAVRNPVIECLGCRSELAHIQNEFKSAHTKKRSKKPVSGLRFERGMQPSYRAAVSTQDLEGTEVQGTGLPGVP